MPTSLLLPCFEVRDRLILVVQEGKSAAQLQIYQYRCAALLCSIIGMSSWVTIIRVEQ